MKQAITALSLTTLGLTTAHNAKTGNHYYETVYASTTAVDDFAVLFRNGEMTFAASDGAAVKIFYQSLVADGGATYTERLYQLDTYALEPVDATLDDNFPNNVALRPDGETNNAFISSSAANNRGRVAVYEGKYSTWSLQQFLSPTEEYLDAADYFGKQLAFDESYETFYVGCANCSSANSKRHGAIYTYKKGGNKAWSQAQTIYFPNVYNLGWEGLKVKGDLLLADISDVPRDVALTPPADYKSSTVVLRKDAGGNYHPEQILSLKTLDIDNFDVEENTIVLSAQTQGYKALTDVGAVYVLAPASLPAPPGKPRPVQWSVQQVLYADTPVDGDKFGTALDLDGDRLTVQPGTSTANYIFERASNGKWSLQQVLETSDVPATRAVLNGGYLAAQTAAGIDIFDVFQREECLVVSLEDQFGDGWDVAKLVVTRPDGTKDYFTNHCDTENPRQIRYCPKDVDASGVYHFAIVDAQKAINNWEIVWRVLNEKTGDWVVGDVATKLDFEWDSNYGYFNSRKVEKALPNATCVDCPGRPTDKPTPVLRRGLKGDDSHGTQHPTHTPAPTLTTSLGPYNWRTLTLKGDNPWYESEYRAAYYYVSDSKSRRLITKGTFCDSGLTTKDCWLDLPDGEYNIRVGGALLRQGDTTFEWYYCGSDNPIKAQQQITIKVEDNNCVAFAQHDNVAFCGRTDPTSIVILDFMIMGASSSNSLSVHDRQILSEAVANAFQGVSAQDVVISSAVQSGSGSYLVSAQVNFRHSTTGYDTLTADGIHTLLSSVQSYMNAEGPRSIWAGLQAAQHSNIFHTASSVQFISAEVVGSKDITPAYTVDEVQTFSDSVTLSADETKSTSSSPLGAISYAGYAVAGVLAAAVVALFATGRKREQASAPVAQDEVMDSSKRVQLKDLNLNAPSVADLKQLVKDEDEVLKVMLSRP